MLGESQQDSTPLIADKEDNKEESKENDDTEETIFHGDESLDASIGKEKALEKFLRETAGEHDRKGLDSLDAAEDLGLQGEEIIPNEVTHLESGINLEGKEEERGEGVSFVTEAPDGNDSQVVTQPLNVENTAGLKSEASPLIDKDSENSDKKNKKGKDSKFKDQQPGFVCCTIL